MEDFTSAKVGDVVIATSYWVKKVSKITRVTKTCVEVDGALYRKSDGFSYHSSTYYCAISHATPIKIQAIKDKEYRDELVSKITEAVTPQKIEHMTKDKLEALAKALDIKIEQ